MRACIASGDTSFGRCESMVADEDVYMGVSRDGDERRGIRRCCQMAKGGSDGN
jgi:hypothetical protein